VMLGLSLFESQEVKYQTIVGSQVSVKKLVEKLAILMGSFSAYI